MQVENEVVTGVCKEKRKSTQVSTANSPRAL